MESSKVSAATAGLRSDALGFAESVVMGIAGTGPAYSVAASTATLVGAVGVYAPHQLDAHSAPPAEDEQPVLRGNQGENAFSPRSPRDKPEYTAEIERQATVNAANAKLTAILSDRLADRMDEVIALLGMAERWRVGPALRDALVARREAKAIVPVDPDELPLPFSPPPSQAEARFVNGFR